MASNQLLTPVGRLVMGSLYKPQTTDAEGRPLVVKTGPQAGQPRKDYFFALAIAKAGEQHWAHTPWGKLIYETAVASFPGGQTQSPSFAWKVVDGDSAVPNKRGVAPRTREGYPGHWVLSFSSGFPPKIYNADGTQAITDPDAVKLGYYVQVEGTVAGNDSLQQPGVFLNHRMVALAAYGPEIVTGPDPKSVGFGQGVALPAGASAVPLAGFTPPVTPGALPPLPGAGGAAVPALPTLPGAQASAPGALPQLTPAAASMMPPSSVPAVPVVPHPGFLAVPAAPVRQLTPAAQGATYEQLIAAGWTDALLVQNGLMIG